MMRIGIVILGLGLVVTACDVGDVGAGPPGGGGDAGGGGNTPDFAVCMDRRSPVDIAHKHADDQTSHKGQNCIAAGCHLNSNLGAGAPGFQFAGTLYTAGNMTMPQAGAVVRIKSGTMVLTSYSDADGNFFFPAGSLMGSFNANTNVSACPTGPTSMVGPLAGGSGAGGGANSCNLCHTTGANAMAAPISM
jgi:hypothetical protein